jgi:hypothetical protein
LYGGGERMGVRRFREVFDEKSERVCSPEERKGRKG